jgi:hypothetical protein
VIEAEKRELKKRFQVVFQGSSLRRIVQNSLIFSGVTGSGGVPNKLIYDSDGSPIGITIDE